MAEFETILSTCEQKLQEGVASKAAGKALAEVNAELESAVESGGDATSLVGSLTRKLHESGVLPGLTVGFMRESFSDLDLDGNGYVNKSELSKVLNSEKMADALTPMEQQLLKYASHNIKEIWKSHNDSGFDSKGITRKDLDKYEQAAAAKYARHAASCRMLSAYGKSTQMAGVDQNGDSFLTESELQTARRYASSSQREILDFMVGNFKEISTVSNDQRFFETKISLKDIQGFQTRAALADLPEDLTRFRYTIVKKATQPSSFLAGKKHGPDRLLVYGQRYFKNLDLDDNGYITAREIGKILQSDRWSKQFSVEERQVLASMKEKVNVIQKARNDEYFTENNGISLEDLKAYADHEAKNSAEFPTQPGNYKRTMTVEGVEREYLIHIPSSYDKSKPMPLVLQLHCTFGSCEETAAKTGWSNKADQEGFVVIYPNARGSAGDRLRSWNADRSPLNSVDDVHFVSRLVDTAKECLAVDGSRVYVSGFSNGGMLAHQIGCRLSDKVAAIASVGGSMNGTETAAKNPVSTLIIHGTDDILVPYQGRSNPFKLWFLNMKSVEYSTAFWKRQNGTNKSECVEVAPGVRKDRCYRDGRPAEVVCYTVKGGGHVWPGSTQKQWFGESVPGFNATDTIWKFFSGQTKKGG